MTNFKAFIALSVSLLAVACDVQAEQGASFESAATPVQVEDPCTQESIVLHAEDALLVEPMVLGTTYNLEPGRVASHSRFAASDTPDEGLVIFRFKTECEAPLRFSALVRDPVPGRLVGEGVDDPDTFHMQLDDGEEFTWELGCQTEGAEEKWGWHQVREWTGECSDGEELDIQAVPAGEHILTFRAAEAYQGTKWSALASVRVEVAQ